MYYEIARMKRIISSKPITYVTYDTISDDTEKINMEIDYIRTIIFKTEKLNNYWYITEYKEEKYNQ